MYLAPMGEHSFLDASTDVLGETPNLFEMVTVTAAQACGKQLLL